MVPGVDYKEYEEWGELLPPESEINAVCRRCFPTGHAEAKAKAEEGEQSEEDSDSSSSSSSDSPTKRARKGEKASRP